MHHRYVLMPVFWNTKDYRRPSGVKAAKDEAVAPCFVSRFERLVAERA